ncbi:MAG: chromate transporter [Xanthobacteraceae bacterium]|nr:chromate transporter [Xanthobacteraceae bacterium]
MAASPVNPADDSATPVTPGSIGEIFLAFAWVSLRSFGGVLPWARRMLVIEKRWMTAQEFNEVLALCQFLPGPNIVNLCAVWGRRVRGVPAILASLLGLLGPSVALMVVAGTLYRTYGALPELRGVLAGLAAGAAGLILSTAVQMAEPLVRQRLGAAHVVALATFIAIGVLRLNLPIVLLVLGPVSVALAWRSLDAR